MKRYLDPVLLWTVAARDGDEPGAAECQHSQHLLLGATAPGPAARTGTGAGGCSMTPVPAPVVAGQPGFLKRLAESGVWRAVAERPPHLRSRRTPLADGPEQAAVGRSSTASAQSAPTSCTETRMVPRSLSAASGMSIPASTPVRR